MSQIGVWTEEDRLGKVKHRDTVAHRARKRVAVGGEQNVPALVHTATQCRKLFQVHTNGSAHRATQDCYMSWQQTLKPVFILLPRPLAPSLLHTRKQSSKKDLKKEEKREKTGKKKVGMT